MTVSGACVTTLRNDLLEASISYAARGWHVLALWWAEDGICACPEGDECSSPGKHPIAYMGKRAICPAGVHSATIDEELLRQWWARVPEANVGIATGSVSGIAVLDSDPRNGGDESLRMLEDSLPEGLPETPRSLTGGGGEHVLLAHPGGKVENKKGGDWGLPGLDVKGDGGYIVAPPSLHLSGRRYEWDSGAHPDDVPVATMPEALRARLSTARSSSSVGGGHTITAGETNISSILEGVPEGERGIALFRMAAKLRRVDVPYAVARELVLQAAAASVPPYSDRAAVKHLDSAYGRYEPSDVPVTETVEAGSDDDTPVVTPRFRLWSVEEIESQPPPKFLIDGVLVENTLALISARERSFKTFMILDMVACIASGQSWNGRTVDPGSVVYISAEGSSGLGKRTKAWKKTHAIAALPRLTVLREPVQMLDSKDVDELLALLLTQQEQPKVIVFDTLARCMVGGEENSAKDMGQFVAACERLRRATGATVIVIHHVSKGKDEARGSGALLGAVDTHLHMSRDGNVVVLQCVKQKDFDEFDPMYFVGDVVPLENGETSLVVKATKFTIDSLKENERIVLEVLTGQFQGGVDSNAEWLAACAARKVSRSVYYRARAVLIKSGAVVETGGRFVAPLQQHAQEHEVPGTQETSPRDSRPRESQVPHPFRGGTVGHGTGDCPECLEPLQNGICYGCDTRVCEGCGNASGSTLRTLCASCALTTTGQERGSE